MQGISEHKLQKRILVRNDPGYIRAKVTFKFLLLFGLGMLLGGAFFRSEYVDRSALDVSLIEKHFDSVFVGCETFSDNLMTALVLSKVEIRYLILIFISGFTYFCFIASGFMMLGRGFLVGFSTSCLVYLGRLYPETVGADAIGGFVIFHTLSSVILICLSVSAYIFSFDFRGIKRNHYVLRRAPTIYNYAFALILALGGLLMNGFFYCIFVSFMKV